jgi:hypothetical protein
MVTIDILVVLFSPNVRDSANRFPKDRIYIRAAHGGKARRAWNEGAIPVRACCRRRMNAVIGDGSIEV